MVTQSVSIPVAGAVKDKPFKVVIVGGGVAGLSLAHCLEKAGIDYVMLEKGVIAPPWGTSISVHPNGCRILDQIGALEEAEKYCVPMERFYNRTSSGRAFVYDFFFQAVRSRSGYTTLTLERRLFLKALYDTLIHKERIHEHTRVKEVIDVPGASKVVLIDGTEHEGDLVVGADGVHSLCRELMWKKANETIEGYISSAEKRSRFCFPFRYPCKYMRLTIDSHEDDLRGNHCLRAPNARTRTEPHAQHLVRQSLLLDALPA
jgi:2-polyprenyl-6-methoxyphenol hydroxylase-like FAD-dependent oxidoreductase